MFEPIGDSRTFKNWRKGEMGEKYLRQSKRSEAMFAQLAETQEGDIILVPIQFGKRHRGKSVRRARETFTSNEFGAGSFIGAVVNYTHPKREQVWEQLHQDFAGDEYRFDGDDDWTCAPLLLWNGGRLRFGARGADVAYVRYGSVSLFLPKSLLKPTKDVIYLASFVYIFVDRIHPPSILPILSR
jgi:hypothetical protein